MNLARTTTAKRLHAVPFLFSVSNVQFQFPFPISISFPFPAFPYAVFGAAGPDSSLIELVNIFMVNESAK